MKHNNLNNRNTNSKITATKVLSLTTIILVLVGTTVTTTTTTPLAYAWINPDTDPAQPYAPMAASEDGNNVYVVWWTNRSGNWEVMFRASNDGGATFGDRINLSNSPDTQSQTAEILAVGDSVYVTWWELNENVHPHTNESVLRVSNDGGQTFGPVINLGTNGTISGTEEEGGGEEGVEEAVEEAAAGEGGG
jgi:hypothetical protein